MLCSSQQNRELTRAPTRIFVWRQSLRVGVRAEGIDLYGKSEPLQGTRCGPDRRRVPAAQRGCRQKAPTRRGRRGHARRGRRGLPAGPGVPGVRRRGRLEERIDHGRGFKVALQLLRQEVHPPPPAPSSNIAESRSPSGSPSSGSCSATFPSSVRPSCAASPTRPPSIGGTVCSPQYPATSTGTSTSSGSTRHDG